MRFRDSLHFKSLYFAIWAAIGAYWPFIYIYYRTEIGLTGIQIGLIVTLSALTGTLSATLWGMLNDRVGRTRLLLVIQSACLAAVCMALSVQQHLVAILAMASLFTVFSSPIMPLLDTTTLSSLGERRDQYGSYRMWGTIGFVFTCLAMGFLMERIGMRWIFGAYSAGVVAFGLLVLARLPDRPVSRGVARWAGLQEMVRRRAWLIFAISVFILWFAVMGAFAFLGIVIMDMGGSQRLVGLSTTIAAVTEIPMFYFGSRLLRRLGAARLLVMAMAVYVVRLLLYALMPSVSWVLGLALLQGASYGFFLVGTVAYANDLAPESLKSTSQGLLVSVLSLANLTAGLCGGWLYDSVGSRGLFLAMMVASMAALGLFAYQWRREQRIT